MVVTKSETLTLTRNRQQHLPPGSQGGNADVEQVLVGQRGKSGQIDLVRQEKPHIFIQTQRSQHRWQILPLHIRNLVQLIRRRVLQVIAAIQANPRSRGHLVLRVGAFPGLLLLK